MSLLHLCYDHLLVQVMLVRRKDTGYLYAMKTLRKSEIVQKNQIAHVKAERDILSSADNDWLVRLYYSFQDKAHLYFVMEYVPVRLDVMILILISYMIDGAFRVAI